LRKALSAAVGKIAGEVTHEHNRQMPVATTQDRFDTITEHSRKDIPVPDAVAQALKETYLGGAEIIPASILSPASQSDQRAVPKF
jgi:hypothetical protein